MNKKIIIIMSLYIGSILMNTNRVLYGFGELGHQTTGILAKKYLSLESKKEIGCILGKKYTLERISTRPDRMRRSTNDFDWLECSLNKKNIRNNMFAKDSSHCNFISKEWKVTSKFHFLNMDILKTYDEIIKNKENVYYTTMASVYILHFNDIKEIMKSEKDAAIAWMVHAIGDLHQPLHIGDAKDRGGTRIRKSWDGRRTNLHSIWDTRLIRTRKMNAKMYAGFLEKKYEKELSEYKKEKVGLNSVYKWIEESRRIVEDIVYPSVEKGKPIKKNMYIKKYLPVIEKQILKAGIRIAYLLNFLTSYKKGTL